MAKTMHQGFWALPKRPVEATMWYFQYQAVTAGLATIALLRDFHCPWLIPDFLANVFSLTNHSPAKILL